MSWMQTPSDDIEHVHSRRPKTPPGYFRKGLDIKRTLDGDHPDTRPLLNEKRIVDYTFGDAGSDWRMKKLKGIYREAKQSGRRVEDIAVQRYGDLRTFDEAREEEAELDRRQMYSNHKRKEKPSGELYRDRKIQVWVFFRQHRFQDLVLSRTIVSRRTNEINLGRAKRRRI